GAAAPGIERWPPRRQLDDVVGGGGIAIREGSDAEQDVFAGFEVLVSEAMFLVGKSTPQQPDDERGGQRLEDVDFGAREKRRYHLKGRIFRGRADEQDVAGLDMRQESVLLRLVEAVHLVDEDNRAVAGARLALGGGHAFLDLLDARADGGD